MQKLIPLLLTLLLLGCSTAAPVTAEEVLDKFTAAGLSVAAYEEPDDSDGPMPNSYTERLTFTIAEVAPKGGQILTCDTKRHCPSTRRSSVAMRRVCRTIRHSSLIVHSPYSVV